jgi:AraC family transcriptional regulator of adaptative response / DNA-3-methyladenine glycosylase II
MSLISEGALDGDGNSVDRLAERLGIGERQLRRLFVEQLGTSPVSVAQTRRVLFAKQLIHDTNLPMTEVALASGFASLRRFNEVFQNLFHRPPSALRRQAGKDLAASEGEITLQIRYRAPYEWDSMLAFLAARAIPGVEIVESNTYNRTIGFEGAAGTIRIEHLPRKQSLCASIRFPVVRALPAIVGRIRRMFDLGANIEVINKHLSRDRTLAKVIAMRPGLRVPGCWDSFELAVRAVLGQQISVAAARQLAGHLVLAHGRRLSQTNKTHEALTHVFPDAHSLAHSSGIEVKMPASRLRTLKALAQAAASDRSLFCSATELDGALGRLLAIDGVGDWTAQYIALRAMRDTDAFPVTDIGLLRGARKILRASVTPKELLGRSEQWRPWRAYAAQHLWAADSN